MIIFNSGAQRIQLFRAIRISKNTIFLLTAISQNINYVNKRELVWYLLPKVQIMALCEDSDCPGSSPYDRYLFTDSATPGVTRFGLLSSTRYLSIECEENNDPHIKERYTRIRRKFLENLLAVSDVDLVWPHASTEFEPVAGDLVTLTTTDKCTLVLPICL